ncbi:MSHA biogenesis protein MshK [Oxalobacteraceae bacterium R-40]|uniref:MSHA biogenesis protein MshK n=1 Tax=Keguizhuia sedimenti TaxID=3064264 RepID=A0ABU1BMY2_9BURK|nr:MSHA biogenesis protein MshK [Oxalobacteraceae bacterium R-40]
MAQPVNPNINKACRYCGILIAAGVYASWFVPPAFAENLPDPTRPTGAAYADENTGNVISGPVLQSVLTSSGRKLAIISGQTVKQGDSVGNARVVKISDAEVVLAQGKETQVLKLFPVVEKQPSTGRPASKNGMRQ